MPRLQVGTGGGPTADWQPLPTNVGLGNNVYCEWTEKSKCCKISNLYCRIVLIQANNYKIQRYNM